MSNIPIFTYQKNQNNSKSNEENKDLPGRNFEQNMQQIRKSEIDVLTNLDTPFSGYSTPITRSQTMENIENCDISFVSAKSTNIIVETVKNTENIQQNYSNQIKELKDEIESDIKIRIKSLKQEIKESLEEVIRVQCEENQKLKIEIKNLQKEQNQSLDLKQYKNQFQQLEQQQEENILNFEQINSELKSQVIKINNYVQNDIFNQITTMSTQISLNQSQTKSMSQQSDLMFQQQLIKIDQVQQGLNIYKEENKQQIQEIMQSYQNFKQEQEQNEKFLYETQRILNKNEGDIQIFHQNFDKLDTILQQININNQLDKNQIFQSLDENKKTIQEQSLQQYIAIQENFIQMEKKILNNPQLFSILSGMDGKIESFQLEINKILQENDQITAQIQEFQTIKKDQEQKIMPLAFSFGEQKMQETQFQQKIQETQFQQPVHQNPPQIDSPNSKKKDNFIDLTDKDNNMTPLFTPLVYSEDDEGNHLLNLPIKQNNFLQHDEGNNSLNHSIKQINFSQSSIIPQKQMKKKIFEPNIISEENLIIHNLEQDELEKLSNSRFSVEIHEVKKEIQEILKDEKYQYQEDVMQQTDLVNSEIITQPLQMEDSDEHEYKKSEIHKTFNQSKFDENFNAKFSNIYENQICNSTNISQSMYQSKLYNSGMSKQTKNMRYQQQDKVETEQIFESNEYEEDKLMIQSLEQIQQNPIQQSQDSEDQVYQLDEQGFLVDQGGNLINDGNGNLIQLTQDQIKYLEESKQIEEL